MLCNTCNLVMHNKALTKNQQKNPFTHVLYSFLHCYHQRKIRWLERDLNSHLRVSRPPLYPLSYRVNGDWWRVLSNLSGRSILPRLNACHLRTHSVSILFQNHPQRYDKLICFSEFFIGGSSVRMKTN